MYRYRGNDWSAVGGFALVRIGIQQEFMRLVAEAMKEEETIDEEPWPEPQGAQRNRPMTLTEAAQYLHISTRQLQRLRKDKVIRDCRRIGKRGTVNRSDVLRIASASPRKGA